MGRNRYRFALTRWIMVGLLLLSGGVAWAQLPKMQQFFLEVPQEIIPTLGDVERSKIIEAFQSGAKEEPIQNILGKKVTLHQLSDNYIKLNLDTLTELQMKILPYKGRRNYLIAMVVTSLVEPAQSLIVFYDKEWRHLERGQLMEDYVSADFFENPSDIERREVKKALVERGRIFSRIELSPQTAELTIRDTTFEPQELVGNDYSDIAALRKRGGIQMVWDKRRGFRIKK